jgi:hypothetical protein
MRLRIWKSALVVSWIALALLSAPPARGAAGDERAKPLSARGLQNLEAFTRLLGYVRFFHPSDQSAIANWEQVAIAGVQAVEKSKDPAELARDLEDFFAPLAPTVRVFPDGAPPDVPGDLARPAGAQSPTWIAWEHHGVGLGSRPYASRRIEGQASLNASSTPPAPDQPRVYPLGGGVSAMVALALWTDREGTLPHTAGAAPAPDKPAGWKPSGNDRATRLADVALAWTIFQHFYPYFDVVQTDWPAELDKALLRAAKDKNERAFLDTLRLLTAALHDGHGFARHPSQDRSHHLPLVWDWVENRLVVTWADPARAGGLGAGDVVLSLNGKPAAQAFAAEEAFISSATPQHLVWRALQGLLLGPRDEAVRMKVQKYGGKSVQVTVRRSVPFTEGLLMDPRPGVIVEIRPGIFYVDINQVTDNLFNAALNSLSKAKGIVFDLRGYPSNVSTVILQHLVRDNSARSAQFLIPKIVLPNQQGFVWEDSGWPLPPAAPRLEGKIAFLTGGSSISYAETYMGIVENYHLAEIVGGPTAGTNGNVNPFTLPGGYGLRWTGMKVLKQDGSQHHGVGILPTVPVSRTLQGIAEGRDEILEKAIEVVGR